jgi:hypothetical protein
MLDLVESSRKRFYQRRPAGSPELTVFGKAVKNAKTLHHKESHK